jgi:hypothetical protein
MKITKQQLRKIIKEELMKEANEGGEGVHDIFSLPEPEAVEPSGNPKEAMLRQIVAEKQAGEIEGMMVDLFTASAIVSVLDAINETNKEKLLELPVDRMADIAFKMMK